MGIFTRFKDIISSNLNSMLDHAEDPEKMIRLMIREMEETLVELKASCAEAMAARRHVERDLASFEDRAGKWDERASLAVSRGRDDLAREALMEKKRVVSQMDSFHDEMQQADELVERTRADIDLLEEKLAVAKEKQRMLVQRHKTARKRHCARKQARRYHESDVVGRFQRFERDIDRMETRAEMEGPHKDPDDLEYAFRELEVDDDIEQELATLKEKAGK